MSTLNFESIETNPSIDNFLSDTIRRVNDQREAFLLNFFGDIETAKRYGHQWQLHESTDFNADSFKVKFWMENGGAIMKGYHLPSFICNEGADHDWDETVHPLLQTCNVCGAPKWWVDR